MTLPDHLVVSIVEESDWPERSSSTSHESIFDGVAVRLAAVCIVGIMAVLGIVGFA